MIVELSLRSLVRRRSRTLLALAGIAVSAALLLDMTMLASGLTDSFGELTRAQGYALRVTPRGTLPFDSEAGIRGDAALRERLLALDGVRALAPVLGAQLYLVQGDSAHEALFTVGVDPAAQALYAITAGGPPAPGEVIVSDPFAAAYGLAPGDSVRLAAYLDTSLGGPREVHAFAVSGVADFLYDYADQRSLAMPLQDVQRLTGRPDEVSLYAVAATPGHDEERLSRAIEAAAPEVSVYSTTELMAAMDVRLQYFRQLATILGSIALVVTALLVATIVAIGVRERFGEIATLRAIGVSRARLLTGVVAEGLALTAVGCLAGIPLGLWLAGRLDRILLAFPGIPAQLSFFTFDPERVALAFLAVVLIGAGAALLPGSAALRVPLGRALREEAE
jgi:putative ABC transport system permease protein